MMLFPAVQEKAQQELDSVVGHDRLPTMEDFESLPYIRQVTKEALRCTRLPFSPLRVFLCDAHYTLHT